jgi:hypothetical protein
MHITLPEAKDALVRSGYLIESRLEQRLLSAGYYVDTNDAYPDPSTGKSRELDLSALIVNRLSNKNDWVWNVLLIECVNNPEPLTLITKKPIVGFLFPKDVRVAGLPVKLVTKSGRWIAIQEALNLRKFHHYHARRVATQFCSFTKKQHSTEWMAQHEGAHFESFQKLCDAVDYRQDQLFKGWKFNAVETVNIEFYYPILVVQGDLLEAQPRGTSVILKPARHLQFRRTVVRGVESVTYQIDVVTERQFPRLLSLLDAELETVGRRIKARRDVVERSIARIVTSARRLRSPDAIRRAMEQL